MLTFYTEEDLQVINIEETANCRNYLLYLCIVFKLLSPSPPVRCWSCDNQNKYTGCQSLPVRYWLWLPSQIYPLIICHQSPPVQWWSCDHSSKHTQDAKAYRSGTGLQLPSYTHRDFFFILSPIPTGPVLVM